MESSGQSTNIATMFADLGHQVSLLDEEVEGRALAANVRDRILLSLTAIQNDVDSRSSSASHQKVETTFISRRNLEMLFRLTDCRDLLVSYCSSRLIQRLTAHPSCQDVVESVLVDGWLMMLSFRSASAAGLLHRIQILHHIISQRFSNSSQSVDAKEQGLPVVIGNLLVEQWEEFLRFLFHSNSDEVRQSHLYPNIIMSLCSLWIKLIRREIQKSIKGSDSSQNKIMCLTGTLLRRLQTGALSQICHRKCLCVLLECLPYSSLLSPLRVIPPLYHEIARMNICAFKDCHMDDLCVENNPDDIWRGSHLGSNWIQHCVMRSSLSQGFGGFCDTGESCRESGVDGESSLNGGGAMGVDETVLRKLVLLWLRSLAIEAHHSVDEGISSSVDGDICRLLISLEFFVCSLLSSNPDDWLLRLFGEQDDDLFESLLCLLDIFVLTKEKRSSDDVNWKWSRSRFDPCRLFLRFLESGCWDHTLLIDLLMSPETCFLIYITRLLKHIVSDWEHWLTVCRNTDDDKEEEEETAALSADALVVDLSGDTANSSHNNTSSVDEFENAYQSVEMKRSSCVQRFQPMSSLKQLEKNYTSLLSEGNSYSVAGNEDTLQGNAVTASLRKSSSVLSAKSEAVSGLCLNDVGIRSSLNRIIDYSDSEESDGSELTAADQDASFEDDEEPGSSKRDISSDDRLTVTDAFLCCSDDLEVIKTSVNCVKASTEIVSLNSANSLRIVNEAETDCRYSSMSSSSCECHALDDSKDFRLGLSGQSDELTDDSDSQMDIETDSTESDATFDNAAKRIFDELEKSSAGVMPLAMDVANDGKEQCASLVNAMNTLIRLRLCLTRLVSKDIFPYSIGPLERLLELCEERYEEV